MRIPHLMHDDAKGVFGGASEQAPEVRPPVSTLAQNGSASFGKTVMNPDASFLNACFLGAYGENNDLFERLLVDLLRDHIYWRRNFHPDDPPPIPPFAQQDAAYIDFVSRLRHELQLLTARLKRSTPLSSPRYMGHMVSDPLLPGLLAQMVTIPYNPNNVSSDSAAGTIDLEIDVGLQLARMLGFPHDESAQNCAFGHLTSGGTVANYESLWVLRALKYLPLAIRSAAKTCGIQISFNGKSLQANDDWALLNLSVDETIAFADAISSQIQVDTEQRRRFLDALDSCRIDALGSVDFHRDHEGLAPPVVLVAQTAHYSWRKACKLLGLGQNHLLRIPTVDMRMDMDALDRTLSSCAEKHVPVLAIVGILGTTEYGTLDPIHEIVHLRNTWAQRGLGLAVHVDAAWGGYLTSLFREESGGLRSRDAMRQEFRYFPSPRVYKTIAALASVDSVTVDPHKLGYLPYGSGGGFVCRDNRMMDFIAEDVPYIFSNPEYRRKQSYRERFRELGRFILEGSKPGAAAAAVYVTHKTLPLDYAHFGRLPQLSIQATEHLYELMQAMAHRLTDLIHVLIPFEPDSNLLCITFNPVGNTSIQRMNAFAYRVYGHLRVDHARPLQAQQFFSSSTLLYPHSLAPAERNHILSALGLNAWSAADEHAEDSIFVLRHTLMNPWLRDSVNKIDYIAQYCDHLESLLRMELDKTPEAELTG
ncbi:MAG: pyridoxal phosphate-dependent decarboxylase family protein [Gammaproteobacteria bacterium]